MLFLDQVMSDDIDDIQDPKMSHEPSDISFNLYVGLQGPGWLYVLRMPPRGYLRL